MNSRLLFGLFLALVAPLLSAQDAVDLPDTGISGVYEVVVGVEEADPVIEYFAQFGFRVVQRGQMDAGQAERVYGVPSALSSFRLQNGAVDTHGLLRIVAWDEPLGPGVGYAPPETVGQRMAVMRTHDIVRLHDVFSDLREVAGEPWLPTPPVYDDLYGLDSGKYSISNRRVGVREMGVYGELFNHVFFQRYGYTIPGYGTIGDAPLKTSEFTHHDFIVDGDLAVVTAYYSRVFGFRPEADVVIDGDWQAGPRTVFAMEPGESHWYRGFVSPNNICGKLKFFSARDPDFVRDRSQHQRPGELGITLHTLHTPRLDRVRELAVEHGLTLRDIARNEFDERSFLVSGPDGATWQVLALNEATAPAVTKLELVEVDD